MKTIKVIKNCIISMLITLTFLIGFLILFKVYPFGEGTLVINDCMQQIYPFMTVFYNKIKSGENLFYSWNGGMGADYLSTFFFHLCSPTNFLLYLFRNLTLKGFITFTIVLKMTLSAGSFSIYLSKTSEDSNRNAFIIPFSCAYGLSSYIICYYHELMWMDSYLLFPIIMYGYKKLVDEKNPLLYILSLTLAAYCNFYLVYIIGLFLVIWFLLDRHDSIKDFIKKGLIFGLSSLLSIGMSAVALLVSYIHVSSTHVGMEKVLKHSWYGNVFEVIRNQFIFSSPVTISYKTNDANIYAGIFAIVFVIISIFLSEINFIDRIKRVVLIVFLILSMNESILNFIWHGFHEQIMVPNRFSFVFIFIMLVFAYDGLRNINKTNIKRCILGMVIVELVPLILFFFVDFNSSINSGQLLLVCLFIIMVYNILFIIFLLVEKTQKLLVYVISVIMLSEIFLNASYQFTHEIYSSSFAFNKLEKYQELVDSVEKDKTDFYRSELVTDDEFYNANAVCDINGINYFNAIYSLDNFLFHYYNGSFVSENGLDGMGYSQFIEELLAEKYVYVNKNVDCYKDRVNYKKLLENDSVVAYQNINALSLGYGVDRWLLDYTPTLFGSFYNMNQIAMYMTKVNSIYDEIYPQYEINVQGGDITINETDDHLSFNNIVSDYSSRKIDVAYEVPVDGSYYACITNYYKTVITVYVNDTYRRNYHTNLSGVIYIGNVKAGDRVKIEFSNNDLAGYNIEKETIDIRTAILNVPENEKFLEYTRKNEMKILEMNSDYIRSTVDIDEGQILFTSIPYDEGWHVYENGKEIQKTKVVSAFIGLKIEPGKHELEFKYVPVGYVEGCIITAAAWFVFLIFCVLYVKHKKRDINDMKKPAKESLENHDGED